MKIVMGALIGLVWGGLIAWINSMINKAALRANNTKSMLLANFARTLIDVMGLAAVFLLRNVHPFSFEAMIVGTAASLGLLTVLFAYLLSKPEKSHPPVEDAPEEDVAQDG